MIYINTARAILTIKEAEATLSESNLNKAVYRSLNETILQARTVARQAVKSVYNIPQKNLAGINVTKASPKALVATLYASTTPIPMDAFSPVFNTATGKVSVSRRGVQKISAIARKAVVGQGVSIEVIKGRRETIPYAFMIVGGKPRVFARGEYKGGMSYGFVRRYSRVSSTGNDIPIKPLLSVTVHAAVINKNALLVIVKKVEGVFVVILERNVKHLTTPLGPKGM